MERDQQSQQTNKPVSAEELGVDIQGLLDSLPFYVMLVDAGHHIQLANKAVERDLGVSPEQIIGGYCPKVVHGADGPIPKCPLEEAVRTGDAVEREFYDTSSGRWVKSAIYPTGYRTQEGQEIFFHTTYDITREKQAENALRESENKYRSLTESLREVVYRADPESFERTFVNKAVEELYGYTVREWLSDPTLWEKRIHTEDRERVCSQVEEARDKEEPFVCEYRIIRKDGEERWVQDHVNWEKDEWGNVASLNGIVYDVTDAKRSEEQLKLSLQEKETLLREVHHRVKNNLQIVSSLLRRQGRKVGDERYRQLLKESENRVLSMTLIHEKLYHAENMASIDFDKFIRSLVRNLYSSYGVDRNKVVLRADIENVEIPLDAAVPCGLIINELVSNSLKYAFPEGREGEINIAFHSTDENQIELVVSDNGVGLPEHIDMRSEESSGLHLVTVLAENQLNGEITLDKKEGTTFRIAFRRG